MNEKVLSIGGVNLQELASKLPTPFYIYDEAMLEKRMHDFYTYFQSDVFETDVIYASKAFTCKELLKLVNQHHLCLDVVSGGELYTAKQANFPMERIYFHGNNKTLAELQMAFTYGVGNIVVDNAMEADCIVQLANQYQKNINVLLRVNPGVEAHTHKYIVTAHLDSKFGTSIQKEQAIVEMIHTLTSSSYVQFDGFHAHIGSQIFDKQAFVAEIETLMKFMKHVQDTYQIACNALNLGGGFAAYYTSEDHPIPLPEVCQSILSTCAKYKEQYQLPVTKIMIEPGRSIVAEAGSTLYRVGYQKQTESKQYVFVDGGMSDNIRPALYQAKYRCDIVNRMDEAKTQKVCVAGKCCESGDILIEEAYLPKVQKDDLLLIYTTGAYGYSMASNYNRLPRPAVVFVKDGLARIVIQRESYEDLCALECNEEIQ